MRNLSRSVLAMTVVALLAIPAVAGDHGKCDSSTQDCLDYMAKHYKEKGWVGIEGEKVGDAGFFKITAVVEDSPAEVAGLEVGDVLVAINGLEFGTGEKSAWKEIKAEMKPGHQIEYTVKRMGHAKQIPVTLGDVPEAVMAQWVGQHMMEHTVVEVAQK